jgi:hypothetical protein
VLRKKGWLEATEYQRQVTSKDLLKEPDPMIQLINTRVFDAWTLVRTPFDITDRSRSTRLSRDLDT